MADTAGTLTWVQTDESDVAAGFLTVGCRTYRYPNSEQGDWNILQGSRTVAVVELADDDRAALVRQFRPEDLRGLRR